MTYTRKQFSLNVFLMKNILSSFSMQNKIVGFLIKTEISMIKFGTLHAVQGKNARVRKYK